MKDYVVLNFVHIKNMAFWYYKVKQWYSSEIIIDIEACIMYNIKLVWVMIYRAKTHKQTI